MTALQETQAATDALIVAAAKTLRDAKLSGDTETFKLMQRIIPKLGEWGVDVDELVARKAIGHQ